MGSRLCGCWLGFVCSRLPVLVGFVCLSHTGYPAVAAEIEELSILIFDNTGAADAPMITLELVDEEIRISQVQMRRADSDDRGVPAQYVRGRWSPIKLADLHPDERILLHRVTENFIEDEAMNQGVGFPELQPGQVYLAASLKEVGGERNYIRKVYGDSIDDDGTYMMKFLMHLLSKSQYRDRDAVMRERARAWRRLQPD